MTEEDARRIVREELRRMLADDQRLGQIDYRGSSPQFACTCALGQCAVYGTSAAPTCPRNRGLAG